MRALDKYARGKESSDVIESTVASFIIYLIGSSTCFKSEGIFIISF